MNKSQTAYWIMMITNLMCFGIGVICFLYIERLVALRMEKVQQRIPRQAVQYLVILFRLLAATVVLLSGYLFFRLIRIYGCVYPGVVTH